VPTLIVVDDQDDPEVVSRGEQVPQGIVGSTKVVIPDAGHIVNLEQPEKFNRAVDEFLRK
jgi:pimeloyl-ACP methyl ester carboxylesterase